MVTVARVDQFATAGQAWILEALRLRGGLADGQRVLSAALDIAAVMTDMPWFTKRGRAIVTAALSHEPSRVRARSRCPPRVHRAG
jgi:hypothetical protein